MSNSRRILTLAGLVVLFSLLAVLTLGRVFGTVFFAITVAYVLYPIRQRLLGRGFSKRIAAALSTAIAFAVVALVFTPIIYALYVRRGSFFELFATFPETYTVEILGQTYAIALSSLIDAAQSQATQVAINAASAAPVIALKFFLFTLLVYALLLKPNLPAQAFRRTVPPEYHDIVESLHKRLRATLYGLYILQGATALGTFVIALGVFFLLGYDAPVTLAVLSGILQFVPIIGPSMLIGVLVAAELLAENVLQAVLVGGVGLLFIAALPDILVRPRLSEIAADLPGSLYFVGFTGGVLTMGAIGIIAGPVVVALLAEAVDLLAGERSHHEENATSS